jgi:hypothetical protein
MARKKASAPQARTSSPTVTHDFPPIPAGTREACRDGDTNALLAWATALEEGKATVQAAILRRLPALLEKMAPLANKWRQLGQPNGTFQYGGMDCWWYVGEAEMGYAREGEASAVLIRELMIGWDYYHPAVEWLIRRVGFPVVRVDIASARGKRLGRFNSYHLPRGDHFEPLPEGVRLEALWFEDEQLESDGTGDVARQ